MVAATTPMPSRQIDVNHGVDAAPRRFERIVFKIFDPRHAVEASAQGAGIV
jgi:hypothetical protein